MEFRYFCVVGLVMDKNNVIYKWFTGVGGNLVAVQASRLSTALHQASRPGVLPEDAVHGCPNPCNTFFGKSKLIRIYPSCKALKER